MDHKERRTAPTAKRPDAKAKTSWEPVQKWYDKAVGQEGHYYHRHIILPRLLKHWKLEKMPQASVLDLACGQGILARHLPKHVEYLGVDASPSLIKAAKSHDPQDKHLYQVADITKPMHIPDQEFTHAAIILALQNLEDPQNALLNASKLLRNGGRLALILNHPCFRIPRQSSWGIDEKKRLQYRRVDSYMSEHIIPIQAHPGEAKAETVTTSYHWPLSSLTKWLFDSNFSIRLIEEWCSDKESTGSKAKMENRARDEFPLFMALFAEKMESKK